MPANTSGSVERDPDAARKILAPLTGFSWSMGFGTRIRDDVLILWAEEPGKGWPLAYIKRPNGVPPAVWPYVCDAIKTAVAASGGIMFPVAVRR